MLGSATSAGPPAEPQPSRASAKGASRCRSRERGDILMGAQTDARGICRAKIVRRFRRGAVLAHFHGVTRARRSLLRRHVLRRELAAGTEEVLLGLLEEQLLPLRRG